MTAKLEPFDFHDLEPRERRVNNLFGRNYILREASEAGNQKYKNVLARSLSRDAQGNVTPLEGFQETDTILLCECLYELDRDGRLRLTTDGNPDAAYLVPYNVALAWPARVVEQLVKDLKEMSGFAKPPAPSANGQAEGHDPKNLPAAMTASSAPPTG